MNSSLKLIDELNAKMNKCKHCWFFHSWSKWSESFPVLFFYAYLGKKISGSDHAEYYQKRFCVYCGKEGRRKL